jgi:hypothetical protein
MINQIKYWLVPKVCDANERGGWFINQSSNWSEYLNSLNVNMNEGDIIYLGNNIQFSPKLTD